MKLIIGERETELSLKGRNPYKAANDFCDAESVVVVPQRGDDAVDVYLFCVALKARSVSTTLGRYVLD